MGRVKQERVYPCAERVHRVFRGSVELVKWLRISALITEISAAFVAGIRTIRPNTEWPGWASFVLASVVVVGILLRVNAKIIVAFSEKCRRVALRAYGKGVDISQVEASSLVADSPILANWFSGKLPTQSLDEYYESAKPAGNGRVRELYAHSAFYSWRLRRVVWRLDFIGALVFALIGFSVIYGLSMGIRNPAVTERLLDLVCSIVFVFLTAKAAVAAVEVKQSYMECRKISESLLSQKAEDDPSSLATDYDIEMAGGVTIPTVLYRCMRNPLQREWDELKAELP